MPNPLGQPAAPQDPNAAAAAAVTPVTEQIPPAGIPPAPAPDASREEKSRYQARIDQLTAARRAAEERAIQAEERAAQLEAERTRVVPGMRPGQRTEMVGQMSREDWNEWHAEDPAAAIEYMAEVKADQKAKSVMSQVEHATKIETTINEVYKAHPELKQVMTGEKKPEEVPFWQVFDEVAREMPEAQHMARGPLLVMREAERRVKEREAAENEKRIASEAAAAENERQARVGASHTLGSHPQGPAPAAVKLTPEEEKIARKMGMTPEEYAKNKGGK